MLLQPTFQSLASTPGKCASRSTGKNHPNVRTYRAYISQAWYMPTWDNGRHTILLSWAFPLVVTTNKYTLNCRRSGQRNEEDSTKVSSSPSSSFAARVILEFENDLRTRRTGTRTLRDRDCTSDWNRGLHVHRETGEGTDKVLMPSQVDDLYSRFKVACLRTVSTLSKCTFCNVLLCFGIGFVMTEHYCRDHKRVCSVVASGIFR